jgi:hypothetical protein
MRNRPPTEAALSIVQHTQAIEQMLNARCWPRMFFREQNPKPISYFRTDFGVVVCIEVGEISLGHCTSLMQFALPNTPSGRAGNRSGRKYKSEHWFGCVPQKEHTECARWGCFRLGTSRQSMPFWTRCRDSSGITRNFPAPVCPLYWGRFLFCGVALCPGPGVLTSRSNCRTAGNSRRLPRPSHGWRKRFQSPNTRCKKCRPQRIIYVDTSKDDRDHFQVFADKAAAEEWFTENDPEGVAFEYEVRSAQTPSA